MDVYKVLMSIAEKIDLDQSCMGRADDVLCQAAEMQIYGIRYEIESKDKGEFERLDSEGKRKIVGNFHQVAVFGKDCFNPGSLDDCFIVDPDSQEKVYDGQLKYLSDCIEKPDSVVIFESDED